MNLKSDLRFLRGPATLTCMAVFLSCTLPGLTQQPIQVLHNHVRAVVSGGEAALVGPMPSTQELSLSIVLPLRNQAELDDLLAQLYEPSSPKYRQFLGVAQFTEQFGPTADDYEAVTSFVQANGFAVTDTPANRLIIPIKGTVAQIEKAFNIKMNLYQHPTENRVFYSPDREPSLNLSVPVTHVAGLNNFSVPHSASVEASSKEAADAGNYGSGPYLSSDMRLAYYGGTSLTGAGQVVGLFEWGGYNLSDVNESFSNVGQTYSVPINNVLVNGGSASPSGCGNPNGTVSDGEEVLDIVAAIGMAPGLSQIRVYIGPCNDDADVLNKMASEDEAKLISISWLWSPDDPISDDPIFIEMALQGQSVFAASGDWGSYPVSDPSYRYYFPAEDANVTAVGGTVLPAYTLPWPEIAWGAGYCTGFCASGGGISPDGIPIPSWQGGVANTSNGASTTLRNIPDVAANAGSGIYICPMGDCGEWMGTSLATPLWAGFMALVNQQAVAAGAAPNGGVGFINYALYSIGEGANYSNDFHDITSGSNGAYSAVSGYDLVTGWGSPNGQNLINALAALPSTSSPTSVFCSDGKGSTVTNASGPETQSGGNAELISNVEPKGGTIFPNCKWSGFPSVTISSDEQLTLPFNGGGTPPASATYSVMAGTTVLGSGDSSRFTGNQVVTVPAGTNLSTLSVNVEVFGTLNNGASGSVGWIRVQ